MSKRSPADLRAETERFKTEIDLIALAGQYGYAEYRPKHDQTRFAMLRGNPEDGDIILIRRYPNGHQLYIDTRSPDKHGSIIDFMINESPATSKAEIYAQLRAMLADPLARPAAPPRVQASPEPVAVSRQRYFTLDPLEDRSYLLSRGILNKTLDSFPFKGKIGEFRFTHEASGREFRNTAFPLQNATGVVGVQLENTNFKGAQGAKGEGLWVSNIPTTGSPWSLVVAESPIDLLSYYQLQKHSMHDRSHAVLAATCGHPTETQFRLLQDIIDVAKPLVIICACDNDLAGQRFNLNLLGQLSPPRDKSTIAASLADKVPLQALPIDFQTSVRVYTKPASTSERKVTHLASEFRCSYASPEHGIIICKRLEDYVSNFINKPIYEKGLAHEPELIKVRHIQIDKHQSRSEVIFPNLMEYIKLMQEAVLEIRAFNLTNNRYFKVETPQSKDWNDDLKLAPTKAQNQAEPKKPGFSPG